MTLSHQHLHRPLLQGLDKKYKILEVSIFGTSIKSLVIIIHKEWSLRSSWRLPRGCPEASRSSSEGFLDDEEASNTTTATRRQVITRKKHVLQTCGWRFFCLILCCFKLNLFFSFQYNPRSLKCAHSSRRNLIAVANVYMGADNG